MEVRCDKCQARYKVDDARIGPQGLTMRCGKCQNTFKVMRPSVAEAVTDPPKPPPPAAKPLAPRPPPKEGATMTFAAPYLGKPAAPPLAPPAPAAKPAAVAKPAEPAPAVEGAGRTMMFQTGNIKSPAPAKKEPQSSATMVFGQSPVAPAARPAIGKPSENAASTMMFAASPGAAAKAAAKAAPPPRAEPEAESEAPTEASPESEETPADGNPPAGMAAGRHDTVPEGEGDLEGAEPSESGVEAEGAEEDLAPEKPGAFDKAPPKGLLIGVGAGIAVLLLLGVGLFAWKKLSKHPPPPQAIEALTAATAAADKDTLASIAEADSKVKEALDLAGPRSYFPQATATLATIEIQWADALNDQAALWTGRGNKAAEAGDDAKKAEAETKAAELATQARPHLKSAFDTVVPALKQDDKSPELELALADYYRAQRSNSNMNRELKKAQARKAEPTGIALVQGMAAAQEEDGAEKALPKLKDALAANPRNARIHFRMAMAHLMMKDDANALKELKETLKLSPQHERAKMAMELLPASAPAEQK